jgi:hypothetical protein
MADLVFIVVTIGFFALAAAFVAGCDRIVRADRDDRPPVVTESAGVTDEAAA